MSENNKNVPANTGQQAPASQAGQPPKTPALPMEQVFKNQLTNYEDVIVRLVKDTGVAPAKFMEIVYTSVRKNPELLKCDRASLFGSILTAAEFGLMPNTPLGLCYIIPYDDKKTNLKLAQFQFGYAGLVALMYRVPGVKSITTERVFSKELELGMFEYEIFPQKKIIKHKAYIPKDDKDSRGNLAAVYAVIVMEGLENPLFEITFRDELLKAQSLSKGSNSPYSPYNSGSDYNNWMQRKVPIKQIFKMMRRESAPLANKAFEMENIIEQGGIIKSDEQGRITISYTETEQIRKASSLSEKLHQHKNIEEANQVPTEDPLSSVPEATDTTPMSDGATHLDGKNDDGTPKLF